jgi:hypothetical protein
MGGMRRPTDKPKLLLDDGRINTYTGWPVEPRQGDVRVFTDYVEMMFSAYEPKMRQVLKRYFLAYLAWRVRNPLERSGIICGVFGPEGGGKSTFFCKRSVIPVFHSALRGATLLLEEEIARWGSSERAA